MRPLKLLLPLLGTALIGCAPAVVVRPLYDSSEKFTVDKRIEGEWITPDVDRSGVEDRVFLRWSVGNYAEIGGYPVTMRSLAADKDSSDSPKEDTLADYHVRLLTIDGKLFFVADFEEQQIGSLRIWPSDLTPGLIPAQVVGRLWVQQDFLRVAFLDSEWVRKNVPETEWVDLHNGDAPTAALTSPPAEVRALLSQVAENREAFGLVLHFCRVGNPCAAQVAEDELSRFPDDPQSVKAAAELYERKGDFYRAISLRRHWVEIDPKNWEAHQELGNVLLLHREFEAARQEFLASQQSLEPKNAYSPYSYDLAYSYYLEGNYAEAAKAAEQYLSQEFPDSTMILLRHVALVRLGRASEARAFLEKSIATFKGSWEGHFLLLEFQSRLTIAPSGVSSPEYADFYTNRAFFRGMRLALNGDRANATAAFHEVLASAHRLSLLRLASQIELERLQAH